MHGSLLTWLREAHLDIERLVLHPDQSLSLDLKKQDGSQVEVTIPFEISLDEAIMLIEKEVH